MVKIKHSNRHNFISVQDIDTILVCMVRFSGSANLNVLSTISRKPRELARQPNLDKSKPKLHKVHFCARNRGIFRKYSGVYRVGGFKYATGIFGVTECACNETAGKGHYGKARVKKAQVNLDVQ